MGRNAEMGRSDESAWDRVGGRSHRCGSIDVEIGAQLFEDLFAVLVPHHQIDALAPVLSFETFLGFAEQR
jgi:hypothetical protein